MDGWSYESVPKATVYALIQLAAGLAIVRWNVGRAWGESLARESGVDRRFRRSALLVAPAIVVGLLARAWTHTFVAFGLPDALAWENIRVVALESRWGASWQVQCAPPWRLSVHRS